jgi:hypothetical protein
VEAARWHLCWGYLEFETAPLGGCPQNFIEAPTGESHPLPHRRPPALVAESCGRRSGTRSSSWLFLVANRGSRKVSGLSQDFLECSPGRPAIHHLDEEARGEGDAQRNSRGRCRDRHVVEQHREQHQARDHRCHDGSRLGASPISDPEMADTDRRRQISWHCTHVQNIEQMFKSVMSVGLRRRHFPDGDGADILARSANSHARGYAGERGPTPLLCLACLQSGHRIDERVLLS